MNPQRVEKQERRCENLKGYLGMLALSTFMRDMSEGMGKNSRRAIGTPVACHKCGCRGVTLYKDPKGYICIDCKRKQATSNKKGKK